MVTQMHSSMFAGAQLLWGFGSSPQSHSAELTASITELQGTSSIPQQFVEAGQRRQAQLLGQFSQEQFPGHTASCRPAEGICLALAPNFFPLLASSTWAPCSTRWAVHGSTTTCRARPWAPHPVVASQDHTGPSLQGSSLLKLTAQQHFPHKPGMEMAKGESGRL